MLNVYFDGAGGLGNSLFQLGVAVFYCEKYGMKMRLIRGNALLFGTSNQFGKNKVFLKDGQYLSYDKTIFSHLAFINEDQVDHPHVIVHNDYSNNPILNITKSIFIKGYNQNVQLFLEYAHKIPQYINIDDVYIKNYIHEKYGDISDGVAICIRIGSDFANMKSITKQSYYKALDFLKTRGESTDKLYVISDIPVKNYLDGSISYTEIDESDIVQIYFGIMCKNYILSESTFHLWIAYLGTDFGKNTKKNVVCFNKTDITNRNLNLDSFIRIDY